MRVYGDALAQYIQKNARNLLCSLLLFSLGIIGGSFYCATLAPAQMQELQLMFSGGDGLFASADTFAVFRASLAQYLQVWLMLSLCGTCFLGVLLAPVFVGVRGFVCGFCVSLFWLLFSYRGLLAALLGLLPQMLLLLPAMQMLCVAAAVQVHTASSLQGRAERRLCFVTYAGFCLVLVLVFVAAALYEGYAGWRLILQLLA